VTRDERPLMDRPLIKAGVYAWAVVGLLLLIIFGTRVLTTLSVLVIPLLLALFPAALLSPPTEWLKRRGFPPALAATCTLAGFLIVLAGLVAVLAPQIRAEMPRLVEAVRDGFVQLQAFIETGPLGIDEQTINEWVDRLREADVGEQAGRVVLGFAAAVLEGVVGLIFLFVALFFYLKDGERIARWLHGLLPQRQRDDGMAMGITAWRTIGAYFRGQLIVALVDAVFIGLGLWLLGVPLALPLAVIVFFGGLFPIVGAFVSGALAVLVALATEGFLIALAVLAVVIAVQQLESNLLAPIVLGRATQLHPLAVILALTGGGVTMGILGAFIAVPIVASVTRAIGHVRDRPEPVLSERPGDARSAPG
jgi:putative heme transporter